MGKSYYIGSYFKIIRERKWLPLGAAALIAVSASASLTPSTASAGVKFHPGHYIQPQGGDQSVNGFTMKAAYNEMEKNPAFVGVQIRLDWAQLETSKDNYNFSIIDGHLNKLANSGSKNKRLVVFIHIKGFTNEKLVPSYLTDASSSIYEKGVFPWGNDINGTNANELKGYNIKLWNDGVRDRLVQLMKRLGDKYNSHSHFEGVGFSESAFGKPLIPVTDAQEKKYYDNLIYVQQKMRLAFPNTMTFQFTNYPRSILKNLIGALKDMGATLGGPDTWLNDTGLTILGTKYTPAGAYTYYPQLSGIVPLAPSVMSGNYKCSRADCNASKGNFAPTVRQLLDYARDNLKANYIFWARDPKYFDKVNSMLSTLKKNNDPAVKLKTDCPIAYGSCITN